MIQYTASMCRDFILQKYFFKRLNPYSLMFVNNFRKQ